MAPKNDYFFYRDSNMTDSAWIVFSKAEIGSLKLVDDRLLWLTCTLSFLLLRLTKLHWICWLLMVFFSSKKIKYYSLRCITLTKLFWTKARPIKMLQLGCQYIIGPSAQILASNCYKLNNLLYHYVTSCFSLSCSSKTITK